MGGGGGYGERGEDGKRRRWGCRRSKQEEDGYQKDIMECNTVIQIIQIIQIIINVFLLLYNSEMEPISSKTASSGERGGFAALEQRVSN